MKKNGNILIPLLEPNIPPPSDWLDLLANCYKNQQFSNFGALSIRAEKMISDYLGFPAEAMVCSSNTAGITAALLANNCKGKKVLLSNYTFCATLHSVLSAGAIAVVSDVDVDTWEISTKNIEEALLYNPDLKAVILTRVHGFRRDFREIIDFCNKNNLLVLVDGAAAFPIRNNSYELFDGNLNFLEIFSFHATKSLGIGEGGAVVGSSELVGKTRQSANFGLSYNKDFFVDGINAKMDEFAAARLISALNQFQTYCKKRLDFVQKLRELTSQNKKVILPSNTGDTSWPFFPIKFNSIEDLKLVNENLNENIETRRYYYPSLFHGYKGVANLLNVGPLQILNDISTTTLCLPVLPNLHSELIDLYFSKLGKALDLLNG